MTLLIRSFDRARDLEVWLAMRNRAWAGDPDFMPATIEDFERGERAPGHENFTRFVAELDGRMVGTVSATIDPERTDKKAFMGGPAVIPEARRKSVGTALARRVLDYLSEKGMEQVEAAALTTMPGACELLTSLGFEPVRWFSLMRRSLADLPPDPGKGKAVEIAELDRSESNIPLLLRLNNESFKEHYNYRPITEEELRFMFTAMRETKMELMTYVARVNGEPVGFLGFGIDPREIKQRGRKKGGLYQLGVLKPLRGQGIATSLLIAGMNWLKSKGMEEAELGVDDTNPTRAIRLYEKLGFTVVRKYEHFLKKL